MFVFQPGGTAAGNVYTVWATLFAAANAVNGPVSIYFDGNDNSGECDIPSGTWAFTNGKVVNFIGSPQFDSANASAPNPIVKCLTGCLLSGVDSITDIQFTTTSTSPVFAVWPAAAAS